MKYLPFFLTFLFTSSLLFTSAHAEVFSDVNSTSPYYDAINYVKTNGIVDGYSDGTFRPNEKITRDAFTKIIINSKYSKQEINDCLTHHYVSGADEGAISFGNVFPDVNGGSYGQDQYNSYQYNPYNGSKFAPYICVAKINGIVNGYSSGNFGPQDKTTFDASAKIIANTFNGSALNSTDVNNKFQVYVDYLANRKAIPTSISTLKTEITRGDMVEMIYRLKANIQSKSSKNYAELNIQDKSKNSIVSELLGKWQTTNLMTYTNTSTGLYFEYPSIFSYENVSGSSGKYYEFASAYKNQGTGGEMDTFFFILYDDVDLNTVTSNMAPTNGLVCPTHLGLNIPFENPKFYSQSMETCEDLILFKNKKGTYSGVGIHINRYLAGDPSNPEDKAIYVQQDLVAYKAMMQEILNTMTIK